MSPRAEEIAKRQKLVDELHDLMALIQYPDVDLNAYKMGLFEVYKRCLIMIHAAPLPPEALFDLPEYAPNGVEQRPSLRAIMDGKNAARTDVVLIPKDSYR